VAQDPEGYKNQPALRRFCLSFSHGAGQTQAAIQKRSHQNRVARQSGEQAVTGHVSKLRHAVAALVCGIALAGSALAETRRGPVTNLPLPRFVSMKASEGNVRRGPSLTHRIDWVFKRRDMPLQVTAEYGHWRRVQDRDGAGGWMHYALLSGVRTVLVEQDMLPAHVRPDPKSPVAAAFELGVVARLGECGPEWCEISAGGYSGWAQKKHLWGVTPDELRD
jgi:SH3-like domain-containing protein